MTAHIVAEWPKRDGQVLRVSLDSYNAHPVVDVRIWWCDTEGVWRPGKSGLTIGRAHLSQLADALAKARDADAASRRATE